MERRDWSLEALSELTRVDSLESYEKADGLVAWYEKYLQEGTIENFDLELEDLKKLDELFFKNIRFLKNHVVSTKKDLDETKKMKEFVKN
ncbi:MAG: hypothetical protein ACQERD_06655 [Campylobacterota bacterium]